MSVSLKSSSACALPWSASRYARIPEVLPIPDLIELQRHSYDWFVEKGLRELLDEISPIQDFTGKPMELRFARYEFGEPKYDQLECRDARPDLQPAALRATSSSSSRRPARVKEQRVFMGDFPLMTERRHVHHQRRRARRRQPAGALARRLLHARPRTRPPAATSSTPRSSPTAAPGWSSRPRPSTSSASRSTASASSR